MSENKVITVLVVDDSAVMRLGLRTLLDQDDGIEVVGEAENGDIAVRCATELHPDVILLDIRMPRQGGLSVLSQLAAGSTVIMITFTDDAGAIRRAMDEGAAGYLVHGTFDARSLGHMIRSAKAGVMPVAPMVMSALAGRGHGTEIARLPGDSSKHGSQRAPGRGDGSHRCGPVQQGDQQDALSSREDGQEPHQPNLRHARGNDEGSGHRSVAPGLGSRRARTRVGFGLGPQLGLRTLWRITSVP